MQQAANVRNADKIYYWCLVLLFLHEFNSLREITFSSHFHVAHTSRYLIRENILQRAL